MFRTAHTLGCILVLSVAAVFVTPGLSQAQRGGHGGGGHYSGAHVGGYHVGGYHAGTFHSGYHYGDGRYHGGYGYPYYPYLYNTYPSYDYGAPPPYYGDSTYATPSSDTYQSFYPPPTVIPLDTSAHVTVTVPEGADIWFDGMATTSTGAVRQFNSPPLTPGNHSYEIRARWSENGREVTQTKRVEVAPGAHVSVNFPVPSAASGQAVKKG